MTSLVRITERLRDAVDRLSFGAPVAFVYDPLDYAWPVAKSYLERYGRGPKEVVFLGMNPGPVRSCAGAWSRPCGLPAVTPTICPQ